MMDQHLQADEEVSKWVKKSKTIRSVVRIPGDASTRRYYRVKAESNSYIVMRLEPFAELGAKLPFLAVQAHLKTCGIDVPQIIDHDPKRGFILLEDLGDVTLLKRLQQVGDEATERELYQKVIDSLVQLQVAASPGEPMSGSKRKAKSALPSLEAFHLKFDYEKLMWEVNFTIEHFYRKFLKRKISDKDSKTIQKGFSEICTNLSKEPTVLAHRDFHSRNVMNVPLKNSKERWVMIDFQDARMGPPQYDLASLLRDSYYQLSDNQVSFLLDYYLNQVESLTPQTIDRAHFLRIFDWMSVQRNFKAIGSFSSFMNNRQDPNYLKYIGNTFENIRRTLSRYPKYSKLREVLFHYYYF